MATKRRPEVRQRMLIMPYSSWIVMALRSGDSSACGVERAAELEDGSDSVMSAAVVVLNGW